MDTSDDHINNDDYNTRAQGLKSAVNKEYLNDNFLKKSKDNNHYDLRQMVIKNSEQFYEARGYLRTMIRPARLLFILSL